jgi:hypothetical protein
MQRAWGESLGLIMTSLGLYTYDLTTYYPHSHVPIWAIAWGAVLSTGTLFLSAGTLLIILIFTLHRLRKSILQ